MACPEVAFTLTIDGRQVLNLGVDSGDLFSRVEARIGQVMGRSFIDNALILDTDRDGIRLFGPIGLPTESRSNGRFHTFSSISGQSRTGS